MTRRVFAVLLALALGLGLLGCAAAPGAQGTTAGQGTSLAPATPTQATTAVAADFPVTVTDAAGRQVAIEAEPQTLVSGYYITTSMLIALGQAHKLVGIEAKAATRPIYQLAAPALPQLPSVGTAKELDLEGCAALEPDLIILPLGLKDSVPALEALGLTVITVKPESLTLLQETILLLGTATGAKDRAAALLAYGTETEDFLATALDGAEQPAVYLAGNSSFLKTAGANMYQHTLIEMGGGVNAAAGLEDDYWAEISYEQLLGWNPDIIVIAPAAKYSREDILADGQLSGLDAVKNGRVFAMPAGLEAWDSPVPSGAVGSRWMASVLHPDRYSFDDFCADAARFYQDFYAFDLDTALLTK